MTPWARQELAGAKLPDKRYKESLARVAEGLADNGEECYSKAAGHGGRQAARRVFSLPEVTPEAILAGHYEQTGARCAENKLVLVAQDTTVLDYNGHKATSGLGPIDDRPTSRGLLAHSALAMTTEGLPLGLLHLEVWARDPAEHGKKHLRKQRGMADKESAKWGLALQAIQRAIPPSVEVLVIQDREADVFSFLAQPRRKNVHLLIRASQPRRVEVPEWVEGAEEAPRTLLAVAAAAPILGEVEVTIPRRPGQPPRPVTLTVRATALRVLPPMASRRSDGYSPQTVHVVQACEENPPEGEKPICWVLICTRPVLNLAECLDTVRYYSLRWTIERLHYVLKSGCRVERLQIDRATRLGNAIALYYLVAWRLLYITYVARTEPDAPPETVLASDEITVLAAAANRPVTTVAEAVTAIAILGGQEHYRNSPPPGPKLLWLGLRRLQALTEGWTLALRFGAGTCEPR